MTEHMLTDEQIKKEWSLTPCVDTPSGGLHLGRAIEQAVLQSPELHRRMEAYAAAKVREALEEAAIAAEKAWRENVYNFPLPHIIKAITDTIQSSE